VRNVGIDVLCRFPRTVGREGNGFIVFLAFHQAVISTAGAAAFFGL
jgi:hypothetical protein